MIAAPASGEIKRAYAWTAAGTTVRNLLGFFISMLLARLLEPKDYGLIGMVLVFTSILSILQETGIAQAIVYFKDDEKDSLPTHYTVNVVWGFILAGITIAIAPVIARFYEMPALTSITQVMSVTFILNGFRGVSQALLSKRFLFRDIAIIETISGVTAAVVAVIMAWRGFGVWSLVTNLVLAAFLQTAMVLTRVPVRWTFHPDWECVRRMVRWGTPLTGGSIAWRIYENADYMIIGKVLGQQALGIYTLAFRLATLVNEKIGAIVSRVSFPSFASMQDARDHAVQHWYALTAVLTAVTFPLLAGLAVSAEDFIVVVLGQKWLESVEPLRFLCVVGAMRCLTPVTNNLLSGLGRTDIPFKFSMLNLVVLPPAFVIGCYLGGITGVGIAWVIAFPPICAWLVVQAVRETNTGMAAYLESLRFPTLTALCCAGGMFLAGAALSPGLPRLVLRCTAGLACYAVCVYLHGPSRARVTGIFTKVRSRMVSL